MHLASILICNDTLDWECRRDSLTLFDETSLGRVSPTWAPLMIKFLNLVCNSGTPKKPVFFSVQFLILINGAAVSCNWIYWQLFGANHLVLILRISNCLARNDTQLIWNSTSAIGIAVGVWCSFPNAWNVVSISLPTRLPPWLCWPLHGDTILVAMADEICDADGSWSIHDFFYVNSDATRRHRVRFVLPVQPASRSWICTNG